MSSRQTERDAMQREAEALAKHAEELLDAASAESFPASDPPALTLPASVRERARRLHEAIERERQRDERDEGAGTPNEPG